MNFNPNLLKKVELHTHLDSGLSYHFIKKLIPDMTQKSFCEKYVAPEKCHDLGDFLGKISPSLDLLQKKDVIADAVEDLFIQLKKDNVVYVEMRFAPLLHLRLGLSDRDIVETVLEAMKNASVKYGIEASLILCTLRHFSEDQSLRTAYLVNEYCNYGIVALDLAADEAKYPLNTHLNAFRVVLENGGNVIAHAGEAKGAESVRETINKLNVSRIGHGVRSIENQDVIDLLIERNIHLEICPTCNIICDIYDVYENHPVNLLKRMGVNIGINTDTRTVANITLCEEYSKINRYFDWQYSDFFEINLNALHSSFCSKELKNKLEKEIIIL
ncbi:Aminodeoxyfutalosine deaminase [Photorhabdus australis subsp. thailandensis]|uniref:adenosine deaminase n=1 Tax=Photorhabdus australis subsp. thailandensis TaxID=2805096 RepID=A0A1C0U4F9_9GAMM|nr:adenosine deaminase [Photorhabdus australis]OCQ52773.1 Aminodeoxyfutalosine deaminase [Photorhabdus australis subsp. thailandensis]